MSSSCGPHRAGPPRPASRSCGWPGSRRCSPPRRWPSSRRAGPRASTSRLPSTRTRCRRGSAGSSRRARSGTTSCCGCTSRTRTTRRGCSARARCSRPSPRIPTPVQGCSTEPLVTMRYLPGRDACARGAAPGRSAESTGRPCRSCASTTRTTCSSASSTATGSRRRHPPTRCPTARASSPRWPPGSVGAPSSATQLTPLLESGALVRLGSRDRVDVPLYWQRWRLPSAHLERLSDTVRRESARGGIRPERGRKRGGTVSVAPPTVVG